MTDDPTPRGIDLVAREQAYRQRLIYYRRWLRAVQGSDRYKAASLAAMTTAALHALVADAEACMDDDEDAGRPPSADDLRTWRLALAELNRRGAALTAELQAEEDARRQQEIREREEATLAEMLCLWARCRWDEARQRRWWAALTRLGRTLTRSETRR